MSPARYAIQTFDPIGGRIKCRSVKCMPRITVRGTFVSQEEITHIRDSRCSQSIRGGKVYRETSTFVFKLAFIFYLYTREDRRINDNSIGNSFWTSFSYRFLFNVVCQ